MVSQYDVFLIALDPKIGHEIQKTRPCLILSPDEMNKHLATVIFAPMTTKSHDYPMRVKTLFDRKQAWVVLDQIRTVDKRRLLKKLGRIDTKTMEQVKSIIKRMLVD